MNTGTQTANKFAIGLGAAACALIISFSLPWMQVSFGGYGSVSMSWLDYVTTAGSPWAQDAQSLLIVFGAFAALACAFFVVVKGRRTPTLLGLTLLSFVGAAAGSLWLLVQFNQTFGLSSSSGVGPGLGLWIYLLAALGGGFAAFRLFNSANASVAPLSTGQFPPTPGSPTADYGPVVAPPWVSSPPPSAPFTPPAVAPPAWSVPAVPPPPAWSAPVSAPPAAPSIPPTPEVPVALPPAQAGAPDMRTCSSCSEAVASSARFCPFCGFALSPSA